MNLIRRRFPRLVAILLFTFPCFASATEFKGRIIDRSLVAKSTAKPGIKGATLTLRNSGLQVVGTTQSASSGHFRFRHLKPGRYQLSIQRKGYAASPLVRELDISPGIANDTLERWFYLDPVRLTAVKKANKKKEASLADPFVQWSAGFLFSAEESSFWNNSDSSLSMARLFAASDTSESFRRIGYRLLWSEVSHQERSTVTRVRMAQALQNTLSKKNMVLEELKPFQNVSVDSLEQLVKLLHAIAQGKPFGPKPAKGKKPHPASMADIRRMSIPAEFSLPVALEVVRSGALPLPKRKALVSKIKGLYGTSGKKQLEAAVQPPKPSRSRPQTAEPSESMPDLKAILACLREEASASPGNPSAVFFLGLGELDAGRPREALTFFTRSEALGSSRSLFSKKKVEAHLQLKDTASALSTLTEMSQDEDVETQISGQRGLGILHFASKKFDLAEKALWQAHGLDATSPEAQEAAFLLAEMGLDRSPEGSTESLLQDLVVRRPKDPRPHLWLGELALKRNQEGVAASHFEQAMSLAPREVQYAEALAKLQANQVEWHATLKTLAKHKNRLSSEGLSLYIDALLQTGRPADAVLECEKLYKQAPSAKTLSRWAQALTAAQQPQKAIDLIRKSPYAQDEVVQVMLALALIEVGNTKEGRTLLTPLVSAHPTDPVLHLHLGRCLFEAREYSKASGEFGDALRYRGDLSDALYYQGLSMLKMGRAGESHHYFKELSDRESRAWKAKGFLGRGQAFANEDKPEAAEEYLRRSIALVPSAEAAAHLALVLLKAKKVTEAESWAQRARSLDKNLALGTLAMVDFHLQSGQDEEGLSLAEAELEAHPQSCDHQVIAAKANYQNGLDDRAREICQKAVVHCPGDPGPHFYLGAISARSGDKKVAKGHFEAYVESGGDIQNLPRGYR